MTRTAAEPAVPSASSGNSPQATRETIESIVVAVILAFLFRGFVAEAFVIPTGSLAPTLQGRHLDLTCPQCGFQFRTGASIENDGGGLVARATCQICRFPVDLDRSSPHAWFQTNQDSFNGDRILVSKFAYQLARPERFDVIVFKYPGNAKQNYIKRLIGLPTETVLIKHGDVYVADGSQRDLPLMERVYEIARKPPDKVEAMLQLVDDSHYVGDLLRQAGWPSRWNQESRGPDAERWQIGPKGERFTVSAGSDPSWLRYRHLVPWREDWQRYLVEGRLPPRLESFSGQLITDYYAYNDFFPSSDASGSFGLGWVGDLAMDCELQIESDTGEVSLDLVEGGVHYTCRIDVGTGTATLSIAEGAQPFVDEAQQSLHPTASVPIRGRGRYQLRFANVDDQLLLWVNGRLAAFDGPTTYLPEDPVEPHWSAQDPGDLAPLGVGARNVRMQVHRLKVLRDVYYQAVERDFKAEYGTGHSMDDIREIFSNPHSWATTNLFRSRRTVAFELGEGQYFPMGDNSPQSKDARLWSEGGNRSTGYKDPPPYVKEELLIGKALLIYWPHAWRPFLPNFERLGLIR
jgi:signal peptidase I